MSMQKRTVTGTAALRPFLKHQGGGRGRLLNSCSERALMSIAKKPAATLYLARLRVAVTVKLLRSC